MSLKDEIQTRHNALAEAIASGDVERCAALYTGDAWVMPDAMPTCRGGEGVRGFLGGAIGSGIAAARFTTLDVEAEGNLAVENGRYELYAAHPNGDRAKVDEGRYLMVWRRVNDSWYIHRDMFNHAEPKQ